MTSEETTVSENFVEDGKNKTKLFCERCNSTVLLPMKAVYCEVEVILELILVEGVGSCNSIRSL